MFGQPVVKREERRLEGRVAGDGVDVVEGNQGQLLEAVEELRTVHSQLREGQVGGGRPPRPASAQAACSRWLRPDPAGP